MYYNHVILRQPQTQHSSALTKESEPELIEQTHNHTISIWIVTLWVSLYILFCFSIVSESAFDLNNYYSYLENKKQNYI
jgi:hypothetical protein